jgi:hypothetical protein
MKTPWIKISAAVGAVVLAACSSTDEGHGTRSGAETVGVAEGALTNAGMVPYPAAKDATGALVPAWNGSIVHLMTADAIAQCFAPDTNASHYTGYQDSYLSYVQGLMSTSACGKGVAGANGQTPDLRSPAKRWADQRNDSTCNVDSAGRARAITLARSDARFHTVSTAARSAQVQGYLATALASAQASVEVAEENLCVAQRLREFGTSADALVMSAGDQRLLLEVTRERAQVAVLQYTGLTKALRGFYNDVSAPVPSDDAVDVIHAWAADPASLAALTAMGGDFSAAMQLHVSVTRDFAELLWRSASARSTRGGVETSLVDTDWGPGSWRQRMMALLFGGDPLHAEDPSVFTAWTGDSKVGNPSPWAPPVGYSSLGPGLGGITGSRTEMRWPGQDIYEVAPNCTPSPTTPCRVFDGNVKNWLAPAVTADARDPKVWSLLALARQAPGALNLNAIGKTLSLHTPITQSSQWAMAATYPDPYTVYEVDRSAAAVRNLYVAVEAAVANTDAGCAAVPVPSTCKSYSLANPPPSVTDPNFPESTLLSSRYGITLTHTATLLELLTSASPRLVRGKWSGLIPGGVWDLLPGALMIVGQNGNIGCTANPAPAQCTYVLDPTFKFAQRDATQLEPEYARLVPLPTTQAILGAQRLFGLDWTYANTLRLLGATSALQLARDQLSAPLTRGWVNMAPYAPQQAFFREASRAVDVLNAALGLTSLQVTPATTPVDTFSNDPTPNGHQTRQVQVATFAGSGQPLTANWGFNFTFGAGDPLAAGGTIYVVRDSTVAELASQSTQASGFSGQSVSALLALANQQTLPATGPAPSVYSGSYSCGVQANLGSSTWATCAWGFTLPATFQHPTSGWTVVVNSGSTWRVLVSNLSLFTGYGANTTVWQSGSTQTQMLLTPFEGQTFTLDGALAGMARQALAFNRTNWSQPAYDGFGMPIDWVPPTDPSVFGGSAGQDAVSYYLGAAELAAGNATTAVKSAIDALLQQQTDQAAADAARKQAAGLDAIEQSSLCGSANASCDTSTVSVPGELADYAAATCVTSDSGPQCAAKKVVKAFLDGARSSVTIFKAVNDARSAASPPAFSDYRGGTIQSILLDQWQALHQVNVTATEMVTALADVESQIAVVEAQKKISDYNLYEACGRDLTDAIAAGVSVSAGFIGASVSFSPGPYLQAKEKCDQQTEASQVMGDKQVVQAMNDGIARLFGYAGKLSDLAAQVQQTSIKGYQAMQQTNLAKARANLQASLITESQTTMFGLYVRYHSYDMWRAKALMESARRYAAAARRAIEGRFVVDLSTLDAPEPFVASPSTWADSIFAYDLDVPAAVGLTMSASQSGGVYPNVVSDYVANLKSFVAGYDIGRPTAVAKNDSDIFTIAGPNQRVTFTSGGASTTLLSGDSASWQLFCPATGAWISRGAVPLTTALAQACPGGTAPTRARTTVMLDPWGRPNGGLSRPPFAKRYNARWTQLAVNLVGTGIKDCTKASNVGDCYARSYIAYDATHAGPTWVTDYQEQWHGIDTPLGHIEGGKALAAEQYLDPVANGWSQPYVTAVSRGEWLDQPLGGTYTFDLEVKPELVLERIEGIQVLMQESYWVQQQ